MELKSSEKRSIIYHSIFNYPLTETDLKKWTCKYKFNFNQKKIQFKKVNGFCVLKGQEKNVKKRSNNEKYSKKKLVIAKKAAKLISKIPSVLFIGITGSLAMMNAKKESDIDFLIITKSGWLWVTRLLVYCFLNTTSYILRKPQSENERDALCLNMWLDENDLVWNKKDRNIYTAHEIAQIIPLYNKNKTYQKFLYLNRWILNYWPNSVNMPHAISRKFYAKKTIRHTAYSLKLLEKIAYFFQYQYMKNKITNEVVTPTRALFHPRNNSKFILEKMKK